MLTRDQVLDELDHLAGVAHAQCMEYLFIGCALGNDDQDPRVGDAVGRMRSMAIQEMRQLRRIAGALRLAEQPLDLRRATELRQDPPDPPIALPALTAAQLDGGMLDAQLAIAKALDARYARLQPAVDPSGTPVLDGDLRDAVAFVIELGAGHADAFTAFRDALSGLAPSDYLRVTSDVPADDLERTLLDLGDRYYELIVRALRAGFQHAEAESSLVDTALGAMFALDAIDNRLVARHLLPTFTEVG